jgi:hypothetical protein
LHHPHHQHPLLLLLLLGRCPCQENSSFLLACPAVLPEQQQLLLLYQWQVGPQVQLAFHLTSRSPPCHSGYLQTLLLLPPVPLAS